MTKALSISIIGAGNVASSLIPSLLSAGCNIEMLCAKTSENVSVLSHKYNIPYSLNILDISSEIIIITTKDSAINEISNILPDSNKLIIHTAGSVSIDVIGEKHKNVGVLYPLQTFSSQKIISFKNIPICIEASNRESFKTVEQLAYLLSDKIYHLSSAQRKQLHVAAVFVCNFTNLMYSFGYDIAKENNIPFEIFYPLITETASKVLIDSPNNLQTGPAIRNDFNIMKLHKNLLSAELAEKYSTLSDWIITKFGKS